MTSNPTSEGLVERLEADIAGRHDWQDVITKAGPVRALIAQAATSEALVTSLRNQLEGAKEALRLLRSSAVLLYANAEGCAVHHHGDDFNLFGMPGWLTDSARDIALAASTLYGLEGDQEVRSENASPSPLDAARHSSDPDAEPSAPECPFCGDPLEVHVEPTEGGADIVGDCRRCNETVAVEQ